MTILHVLHQKLFVLRSLKRWRQELPGLENLQYLVSDDAVAKLGFILVNFSYDVPFNYHDLKEIRAWRLFYLPPHTAMKRIFLFFFVFFWLTASADAQETFVSLGSGGGFAGTATVYKVTPKGFVFKGDGVGDIKFTLCGKIKKARAKEIIAQVTDQTRAATAFSHPGNLYYFMGFKEKEEQQTITWGDADHPVPGEIKKLYEEVHANVSEIKYKPIK